MSKLKPLDQQTIVVTGASSGHGLCTAQMAAKAGAKVMLSSRDEETLKSLVEEINASGGTADYFVADVGDEEAVNALAAKTIERFGGFDTWVNNAGTGIYGEALETPTDEHRKLFDTNYFGVVYGSLAAVRHLKDKPEGGALVNVGSINGDMGGPLLSAYNASKHAVKGFTDSLRIEMMKNEHPVSVTLIKPSAITTPFTEHGRNLTGYKPILPPPHYNPNLVANAILDAAQNERRSITVGGGGKFQVLGATMLPWLFDQIGKRMDGALVNYDRPVENSKGSLYKPSGPRGEAEGELSGRSFSLFTTARLNPIKSLAIAGTLVVGAVVLASRSRVARA